MAIDNDFDREVILTAAKGNEIWSMFLSGMTPRQIIDATGLAETTVRDHLEKLNNDVSFEMMELSETIHIRNLARLEQLSAIIWPYATGTFEGGQGIPDNSTIKVLLQIYKMEQEWVALVQEQRAKMEREEKRADIIEASSRTFTTSDELYQEAQARMEEDWLGEHYDGADVPIETLYEFVEQKAPAADPRLDELEDIVRKLVKEDEHDEAEDD